MREFSKETIEIDGKEYTLFLNRLGIVAYEKYTEKLQNEIKELAGEVIEAGNKINLDDDIEITDDTNPFEDEFVKKADELTTKAEKIGLDISKRIYWILMYNDHKLSLEEVGKLYDKACKEYGREQVDELALQMIEEVNTNKFQNENSNLKNLKALHRQKK